MVNLTSGLGTSIDKSETSFFTPTRIYWRSPLEILYVQSASAGKFVDFPVEDMLANWREFTDASDTDIERMHAAEQKHGIKPKLSKAMKAARAYGTGLLVMVSGEDSLEMPLIPERVRKGDLAAVRYFDRFDASITQRYMGLDHPKWRQPEFYDLHPSSGEVMRVHESRVIRFDGMTALTESGWFNYDYDWGIPPLIPLIISLMQDQVFASAVAHLSQEASVGILEVRGVEGRHSRRRRPERNIR